MSHPEFLSWQDFYTSFPFDDRARHLRPAALIAAAIAGGDMKKYLDMLAPPEPVDIPDGLSEIDMSFFKAFGMKPTKGA